jgi:hypothetical protein
MEGGAARPGAVECVAHITGGYEPREVPRGPGVTGGHPGAGGQGGYPRNGRGGVTEGVPRG